MFKKYSRKWYFSSKGYHILHYRAYWDLQSLFKELELNTLAEQKKQSYCCLDVQYKEHSNNLAPHNTIIFAYYVYNLSILRCYKLGVVAYTLSRGDQAEFLPDFLPISSPCSPPPPPLLPFLLHHHLLLSPIYLTSWLLWRWRELHIQILYLIFHRNSTIRTKFNKNRTNLKK